MQKFIDQLSWDEFYKVSKKRTYPLKKISEFNRLILHSKNFFIVAGYGAFSPGYVLIITKDFIPSFGLIDEKNIDEINFLKNEIKISHLKLYKRKTIIFEHGMCACIGGLDRAHLHLMSTNPSSNKESYIQAINNALYNRKAGIECIEFNKTILRNIYDINQFYSHIIEKNKKYNFKNIKIIGKLLKYNDLKDLDHNLWPKITLKHINKGGHYVYFNADNDCSFLTTKNFQTQFGREVSYYNEQFLDKKFNDKYEKLSPKDNSLEIWKWQNFKFEDEILKTINKLRKYFKRRVVEDKKNYKKYEIEVL